jgi:hypothetical protein
MCQVNNFNTDHERNVKACNCCKNKESAAAVSATLVERDRIIKLLEDGLYEMIGNNPLWTVKDVIALIKGESND